MATGRREKAAAAKARPIRAGEPSRWHSQMAVSMNSVAVTWAKCHDEPACAEYQTMVPNAKTRERTTRGQRSTPMRRSTSETIATLRAPNPMEGQAWFTSGPKTTTNGRTSSAGAGGYTT